MSKKWFNNPTVLLSLIIFLAFVVRLYGFANPIADWHSWRQADTSAVSRNFVKMGYDVLHPKFDDLSNVPSGRDNPEGYRFVEFPIFNLLQAILYQTIGILTLEEWGRLVTIFSSLASIFFIFALVKKYANEKAALLSAVFFAFLPYSIFYGRVILPDPTMVATSLGGVYFFTKYLNEKKPGVKYFLLSLIFSTISLLLKPYALFFLLPIAYLSFEKYKLLVFKNWRLYLYVIICFTPLVLWRYHVTQFPEGVPSNIWLLNGNGIRFRPAFFRWIIYERLIKLIFGYIGIIFLFTGVIKVINKRMMFFITYFLGAILYTVIFATGNVQHDYYQILIMPILAMTGGIGCDFLITYLKIKTKREYIGYLLVAILFSTSIYFSWHQVKGYFWINNPSIVIAGQAVDKLVPKDALVVAIYTGDSSFLYQTNRRGWPTLQNGLDDLIEKGADYMVFADPTEEFYEFGGPYKIVSKSNEYVIFDLHNKK